MVRFDARELQVSSTVAAGSRQGKITDRTTAGIHLECTGGPVYDVTDGLSQMAGRVAACAGRGVLRET